MLDSVVKINLSKLHYKAITKKKLTQLMRQIEKLKLSNLNYNHVRKMCLLTKLKGPFMKYNNVYIEED